jgi:drug/metabolite transporter (DMT)-like permease
MTLPLWLAALVLLAALIHAGWNAMVKSSSDRLLTLAVIIAVGSLAALVMTPFVSFPAAPAWPYLVGGILLHNAFYAFMLMSYRFGDLSQVYPLIRGSVPLIVTFLAALAVNELPSPNTLLAVAIVSLGIVALIFSGGRAHGIAGRTFVLALLAGFMVAGFTVVDGIGTRMAASPWDFIVWLIVLNGIPITIVAVLSRGDRTVTFLRANWAVTAGGGIVSVLGLAIVLYALSHGPMGHVAALRECSILFATLIGAMSLREPFGLRRTAAASAIVGGVAILQLGG